MTGASFEISELQRFAADALRSVGCSDEEAALVAGTLADADLRGLHSHGLLRLSVYVASVRAGGIVADAPMTWVEEGGATALLDAGYGFGQRAMSLGVQRAADLATEYGCSQVGIRRSSHFGTGEQWVRQLTDRGLVGIVGSSTGPSVAPFASAEPLLGTNPISIGLLSSGDSLVLDPATSEAAYRKVVAAEGAGEPIPETWAVDTDGRSTTDASAALAGALRPFGGHTGSGLAVIAEALAVTMTGARFSRDISDMWADPFSQMGTGHLIIALRPARGRGGYAGPGERTGQRYRIRCTSPRPRPRPCARDLRTPAGRRIGPRTPHTAARSDQGSAPLGGGARHRTTPLNPVQHLLDQATALDEPEARQSIPGSSLC